jgi:hypothetical protein
MSEQSPCIDVCRARLVCGLRKTNEEDSDVAEAHALPTNGFAPRVRQIEVAVSMS